MLELEEVPLDHLPPGPTILQSPLWARLKAEFGWRPLAFIVKQKGEVHGKDEAIEEPRPLLLLLRRFPLGRYIAYLPHALGFWADLDTEVRAERLRLLSRELASRLPRGCLFIRYDLPWSADGGLLTKAPYDIQPPSTVVLPIGESEEEILAGMKRKTRYNIRLAEKKGVETRIYSAEEALVPSGPLDKWYELYEETAARDAIAIHSKTYYTRFFELVAGQQGLDGEPAAGQGEQRERGRRGRPSLYLITAEHEGDLLAGIVVSIYGETATYVYGAGSNYKRNLMASYAVQWEAIRLAKREGALAYDLFGIPPSDDPSHPMHGLYRFKTGFGGTIIHRAGCRDYPLRPMQYRVYRLLERLRYFYFKKLKKRR